MKEKTKAKFKCRKCEEDMVEFTPSIDFMSFLAPKQMYCINKTCEHYGFVTVAAIKVDNEIK